jgi:hypothetical protein
MVLNTCIRVLGALFVADTFDLGTLAAGANTVVPITGILLSTTAVTPLAVITIH